MQDEARGQKLNEIWRAALALDPDRRPEFLLTACEGDEDLLAEVESLLASDEATGDFLEPPEPTLTADLTAKTISHYRIVGKVGEGGMGAVYKARDTRLDRTVAIKVVNAEFTQRFGREARAIASLNHPHICVLHDVGEHKGAPYLVMEYVEGKPLKGPLPVAEALGYAIQIAEALAAAHRAGIVHRDLKPDNILLTRDNGVKVLDFGLAKLRNGRGDESFSTSLTRQGAITGTAAYMSPEQAKGQQVDERSDIFSFGVVLYELLSGRRAFRRETMGATMAAVIDVEPPPLREARPAVARIVGRMLSKKREARYQSAEEVLKDLEAAAREKPWWQTRRAVVGMAAAPVVLAGAALGVNVRGWRTQLAKWMAVPAGPSIRLAVLPFANLSGDPEQEYFSDGLTQEMITELGSLHPATLSVIARTSVMRYKGSRKPIDQVGLELGVDYILEGSARREEARVRITAELIQVRSQAQLWAASFERELASVLSLQSEVAKKVADSLALKLLPAEQVRLARAKPVNSEAYEAYLKGMQHVYELTPQGLATASQYFDLALQKDPKSARAHAGVSWVWVGRAQMGFSAPAEAVPKARTAALKAIELDGTLAEAHSILSSIYCFHDWDWAGADAEYRRAIELNPSLAEARAYYSHFLMIMRRPKEALAQMERALELDPFNPLFQAIYGMDLNFAHRYDDALALLRKTLSTQPDNPVARSTLRVTYHHRGMFKEAFEEWKAAYAAKGDSETVDALSRGYLEGGYPVAMRRAAETLATRPPAAARPWQTATLYARAGEYRKAIEWFEKAYEERDPNMPYLSVDPLFDGLRSEPRFQALLHRMNLPQ